MKDAREKARDTKMSKARTGRAARDTKMKYARAGRAAHTGFIN